jgi:LPPG:FO 2-phospho-L-lactate transferase
VSGPVVVLAGGTGGAKLARGLLDVVGDDLVVVANTADDIEIHGGYVSPDPDLCTFWLADEIDERGWGLRDDTFAVMDGLRALGDDVWFSLGDRDLAVCLLRARRLREGRRLTEIAAEIATAFGVTARVLPMCDEPVRTRVRVEGRWVDFQRFMIVERGAVPGPHLDSLERVAFDGLDSASASPEVLDALASARAIIVGPSNPAISVLPILGVPGVRDAIAAASAPVVAVSPIVGGVAVKGPTEHFMRAAGHTADVAGIVGCYEGLLDGIVTDEDPHGLPVPALRTETMMGDDAQRERVARETLDFALGLA